MSTPEQIAAGFARAADALTDDKALISRVVLVVEANAKRATPVATGLLRRSITSRVETAMRGVVGTNVRYARHVHNGARGRAGRPFLRQGLDASQSRIEALLRRHGQDVLGKIT